MYFFLKAIFFLLFMLHIDYCINYFIAMHCVKKCRGALIADHLETDKEIFLKAAPSTQLMFLSDHTGI